MDTRFERKTVRVLPLNEKWFRGVSPDAKRHLLNSLASLEAGRAPTPSFKLYGKTDVSLVDDFFNEIKRKGIQVPEWQLAYEMSRKAKFGPQGGYAPWKELKEGFELYYSRPMPCNGKVSVADHYADLRCRLKSITDTLKYLDEKDKIQDRASGWPDFNLKKTDPKAQRDAISLARNGKWKEGFGYVFSRYNKLKKRLFFPMPMCLMLLEAQYYTDFLAQIQKSLRSEKSKSPFTFWADKIGFDPMFEDIVTPLCKGYDNLVYVQRDFEKMDTTTGFEQTDFSFIPKLAAAYGIKRDSKAYSTLRDLLYFGATCPIATPDGMYTGYRGKASGANTTNGDETCCNEDFDAELQLILTKRCEAKGIQFRLLYTGGNGDDGMTIYSLKDLTRLDEFKKLIQEAAEMAGKDFGFRLQASKWFISTEYGLYCQRMICKEDDAIKNMYPATLILNSIVNPEKEYSPSDWDKDYRDLDIIEKLDNGRNLPYFHELVDFVDNGMKYHLLGQDEKETRRILSKYDKYRALQEDSFNYQDLDTRNEITSSPTIKYLMAKRGY